MNDLLQDLRFGIRTLKSSPGFTAVALATLAIGIGANAAIFSYVDGILLKPLPYPEADRIMRVLEKPPGGGRNGISALNYLDWQKQNTVFEFMAAQTGGSVTLTGVSEPVRLPGQRVSSHYFDIFGIKPMMGRGFAPDEDQMGKGDVAILSHRLWQAQFGSDPGILGRKLILNGRPCSVIGVLPPGGAFDRAYTQIWMPLVFEPQNLTRNFHWLGSYALLKRGVTLQQARAQMDGIGAQIAQAFPDSNKGWGVVVERFADVIIAPDLKQAVLIIMCAVGVVLLIACANLANLMLARSSTREREVAVRASLGAGRWRLIRQFLTESVLLSICGGVLGLAVGWAGMIGLRAAIPPFALPREVTATMDGRVLLFALAISVLTGILFGLAPAIQAARPDLASTIKEGGRGSTAGARQRFRNALVVAEVALAFVLLTASGLLLRSFRNLLRVDPGFETANVITANLPISEKRFPEPAQLNTYLREVIRAVRAVPGVREAALTSALPLEGWGYGMPYLINGRAEVDRANRKACYFKMVTPSYFRTLGITLRKGRLLNEHDVKGSPPVTLINETFARREFKGEEPIGRRVLVQEIVPGRAELGPEIPWEIVGVIADEKINGLNDDRSAGMYVANEQSPVFGVSLLARTAVPPLTLQQSLRRAVQGVSKDQALSEVRSLEQVKNDSTTGERIQALLLGIFAGIAILLAAVGIYGVISYSVAQRTHEIGIRAALGAGGATLVRLILRGGMALTLCGLALGFGAALAVTRLMQNLLFGVGARDAGTLAAVGAVLAGVAVAACYIPARRASKVDPVVALRYE